MFFYPLLSEFLLFCREVSSQNFLAINFNRNIIFSIFCVYVRDNMVFLHCVHNKLNSIVSADSTTDLVNEEYVFQELYYLGWGISFQFIIFIHLIFHQQLVP